MNAGMLTAVPFATASILGIGIGELSDVWLSKEAVHAGSRRSAVAILLGGAACILLRAGVRAMGLAGSALTFALVTDLVRNRADIGKVTSITQLGQLEAELDLMDRNLAQQRERLGVLQADFTGQQKTELIVVVSGYPQAAGLDEVAVTPEDAAPRVLALTPEQRETLRTGGVVQVFHGFVEPRAQSLALRITGGQWPGGDSAFVRLDPPRDRITMLRLHLAPLDTRGAASIEATTWLHDEQLGAREH